MFALPVSNEKKSQVRNILPKIKSKFDIGNPVVLVSGIKSQSFVDVKTNKTLYVGGGDKPTRNGIVVTTNGTGIPAPDTFGRGQYWTRAFISDGITTGGGSLIQSGEAFGGCQFQISSGVLNINKSGITQYATGSIDFTTRREVVVTCDGTEINIWEGGKLVSSATPGGIAFNDHASFSSLYRRDVGSEMLGSGGMALYAEWSFVFPPAVIKEMSKNLYSIFEDEVNYFSLYKTKTGKWLGPAKTRKQRPKNYTKINWSNPITRGLTLAVTPANAINVVDQQPLERAGSMGTKPVFGELAIVAGSFRLPGPNDSSSREAVLYDRHILTALLCTSQSTPSNEDQSFFRGNGSTVSNWALGLHGGSANGPRLQLGSIAFHPPTEGSQLSTTVPQTLIIRGDGTTASFYRDGTLLKSGAYSPTEYQYGDSRRVYFGSLGVLNGQGVTQSTLGLFWNRPLTDAEIVSINANPDQVFEDEIDWFFIETLPPSGPIGKWFPSLNKRKVQPKRHPKLNYNNPVVKNLKALFTPNLREITARGGPPLVGGTYTLGASKILPSTISFTTSASQIPGYIGIDFNAPIDLGSSYSFFVYCSNISSTDPNYQTHILHTEENGSGNDHFSITTDSVFVMMAANPSAPVYVPNVKNPLMYLGVKKDAVLELWIDGVLENTVDTAGSGRVATGLTIGRERGLNNVAENETYAIGIFNKALSATEAKNFTTPWSLLEDETDWGFKSGSSFTIGVPILSLAQLIDLTDTTATPRVTLTF